MDKYYRVLGNPPGEHLFRDRHLHVHAVHFLIALWALNVWIEHRGLNL